MPEEVGKNSFGKHKRMRRPNAFLQFVTKSVEYPRIFLLQL